MTSIAALRSRLLLLLAGWILCGAAPPLAFSPVQPRFAADAAAYAEIWRADGPRIVAALEARSGMVFPPDPIEVIVSEGRPMASYDGRLIRLRASYSPAYKKATLVHELGHRLALALPRRAELDDHRLLYLFLHEVWSDVYGRDFADRMVAIERRIPGGYDYDAAWSWALDQAPEQRRTTLAALRAQLGPSGAGSIRP